MLGGGQHGGGLSLGGMALEDSACRVGLWGSCLLASPWPFWDSGDQSGISPKQAPPLSWGIQAASQERVMAWAEDEPGMRDVRAFR